MAAVDAAEYKQVTVLFADVVRSMDIAAALDMERMREIMTELIERSAAVVRRYGGTVEYNGDGVMALFGAPVALEDHAFRGCLAALAIQEEAKPVGGRGAPPRRRGAAIAGGPEFGSGDRRRDRIGVAGIRRDRRAVGIRPADGIGGAPGRGDALGVDRAARRAHRELAEPEWVHIKGADEPVSARRLMAISPRDGLVGRSESSAGRPALGDGGPRRHRRPRDRRRGGVVNVVGPPGIGKSRVAREAAALAADRGVEVFWAFCESHAADIPSRSVTRMLRAGIGIVDLDGDAARERVRERLPDADAQDLLLLDDLLGIADPDVPLPQIDPDARRRRLTALINTASLARTEPALYIIEDAHWVDAVSESMLADLLTVIPRTKLMVLITSRPEYEGALTRVHGAQTIALAPLG